MKAKGVRLSSNKCISRSVLGALLIIGSAAFADQSETASASYSPQEKAALHNAFEFALGFGYAQGVGSVGSNAPSLTDSGSAGVSVEADFGWRIDPNWLVGLYGTVAWLSNGDRAGNAENNWTVAAGIQGNYHFLPGEGIDPWIGLGAGWRGYFTRRPVGTDARDGIDFARLQVGVDFPVTNGFTIAPYVGATATIFLTQELAQQTSFSNISNPKVNVFFNAGFMGRFDLLGGKG